MFLSSATPFPLSISSLFFIRFSFFLASFDFFHPLQITQHFVSIICPFFLPACFIFYFLSSASILSPTLNHARFTLFSSVLFLDFFTFHSNSLSLSFSTAVSLHLSLSFYIRRRNFTVGVRVYTGEAFVRDSKCPAITRLAGSIACRVTQYLRSSLLPSALPYRPRGG